MKETLLKTNTHLSCGKKFKNIMIKLNKNSVIKSNSGISIIFAIIIIILMGLAGSVFAYLMASSSINSRQGLTNAAAKYAAKSGIEIAAYELGKENDNNTPPNNFAGFSNTPPSGLSCPNIVVPPYGVSGQNLTPPHYYIYSYNLYSGDSNTPAAGGNNSNIGVDNYTPAFCAIVQQYQYNNNTTYNATSCPAYWIITSNGFAGGTLRSVSAEVGTGCKADSATGNTQQQTAIIFAENEVANNNVNDNN